MPPESLRNLAIASGTSVELTPAGESHDVLTNCHRCRLRGYPGRCRACLGSERASAQREGQRGSRGSRRRPSANRGGRSRSGDRSAARRRSRWRASREGARAYAPQRAPEGRSYDTGRQVQSGQSTAPRQSALASPAPRQYSAARQVTAPRAYTTAAPTTDATTPPRRRAAPRARGNNGAQTTGHAPIRSLATRRRGPLLSQPLEALLREALLREALLREALLLPRLPRRVWLRPRLSAHAHRDRLPVAAVLLPPALQHRRLLRGRRRLRLRLHAELLLRPDSGPGLRRRADHGSAA